MDIRILRANLIFISLVFAAISPAPAVSFTAQEDLLMAQNTKEESKAMVEPDTEIKDQIERDPAASRSSRRKKVRKFRVKKKRTAVPKARMTIKKIQRQTIKIAEPPRQVRQYFEAGTDEAELESVINQEINQLFNLLKSSKRRDLRLRLGSLYIEKARLIEYRLYERYDQQMNLFKAKKRKSKPRINLRPTYVYINKAIKLFET